MSSMLAQRVAINKLANSFMAFNTNYQDAGIFGVYAVCDKDAQVDDLVRWLLLLCTLLCSVMPLHGL